MENNNKVKGIFSLVQDSEEWRLPYPRRSHKSLAAWLWSASSQIQRKQNQP